MTNEEIDLFQKTVNSSLLYIGLQSGPGQELFYRLCTQAKRKNKKKSCKNCGGVHETHMCMEGYRD